MTSTTSLLSAYICIASLISMPRFKLALTYEDKVGAFQPQRRPINRLDHHDAFNGLTLSNSKDKCDARRCSRLSFQQTPKKRPQLKRKTPVIQGNSKWHSACSRSSVVLERKRT